MAIFWKIECPNEENEETVDAGVINKRGSIAVMTEVGPSKKDHRYCGKKDGGLRGKANYPNMQYGGQVSSSSTS